MVYLGELLFTLKLSLSAMDISTCGVRKCIGGVPFSFDLNESYINNVRIEVNDKKSVFIENEWRILRGKKRVDYKPVENRHYHYKR